MLDIREEIEGWTARGLRQVIVAQLIDMRGSGVRLPGALFAVAEDGSIAGSVSGGCIEPGLLEAAREFSAQRSEQLRLLQYDQSGGRLFSRLAPCSEMVEVALYRLDIAVYDRLCQIVDGGHAARFSLQLDGPYAARQTAEQVAEPAAHRATGEGRGASSGVTADTDVTTETDVTAEEARGSIVQASEGRLFRYLIAPPLQLVIVGASHVAQHLARLATDIGAAVSVVDPRPAFLTAERFPPRVRLLQSHAPRAFEALAVGEDSAVCALSHDDKIDDAALTAALERGAFYVGALGSPVTHRVRCERLLESGGAGIDRDSLSRIHAPIGVRIGSVTPAEIALAILTEVISEYRVRLPKRAPA